MANNIVLHCSRRGYPICPPLYYPATKEGIAKAKGKRAELMARYLDADVEIHNLSQEAQ